MRLFCILYDGRQVEFRGTLERKIYMGEPFLIENLDVYKILAPEEVMMMTDAYTIPAEWKVSGTGRDF